MSCEEGFADFRSASKDSQSCGHNAFNGPIDWLKFFVHEVSGVDDLDLLDDVLHSVVEALEANLLFQQRGGSFLPVESLIVIPVRACFIVLKWGVNDCLKA